MVCKVEKGQLSFIIVFSLTESIVIWKEEPQLRKCLSQISCRQVSRTFSWLMIYLGMKGRPWLSVPYLGMGPGENRKASKASHGEQVSKVCCFTVCLRSHVHLPVLLQFLSWLSSGNESEFPGSTIWNKSFISRLL